MKILAISDTHGKLYTAQKAIDFSRDLGIATMIHCGDHINDARELERSNPDFKVYAVPGNCDFVAKGDRDLVINLEDVRFLITHGDRHHVKYDYDELYIDGEAYEASIVVFGHTHSAHKEERNGIKLINPGSITQPRDTQFPSFAILEVKHKRIVDIAIFQIQGATSIVRHPYY